MTSPCSAHSEDEASKVSRKLIDLNFSKSTPSTTPPTSKITTRKSLWTMLKTLLITRQSINNVHGTYLLIPEVELLRKICILFLDNQDLHLKAESIINQLDWKKDDVKVPDVPFRFLSAKNCQFGVYFLQGVQCTTLSSDLQDHAENKNRIEDQDEQCVITLADADQSSPPTLREAVRVPGHEDAFRLIVEHVKIIDDMKETLADFMPATSELMDVFREAADSYAACAGGMDEMTRGQHQSLVDQAPFLELAGKNGQDSLENWVRAAKRMIAVMNELKTAI